MQDHAPKTGDELQYQYEGREIDCLPAVVACGWNASKDPWTWVPWDPWERSR